MARQLDLVPELLSAASPLASKVAAALIRRVVSPLARALLLEAWTGVEQHQGAHPLGMAGGEGKRHVAAERQACDDRLLGAGEVEQRLHVAHRQCL